MFPAPIGLSVYSRLKHIVKTVDALKKNDLAQDSLLYIFSDGPKPGDEKKVESVRKYLSSINGFKKVNIVQRNNNSRVFNNRDGIRILLKEYGKLIFLEEDVVTAQGFLNFINTGLELYKDREEIFAICGYTPPVNLDKIYHKDIYLSLRFSAWGFGIWKAQYDKILMEIVDFDKFLQDKKKVRQFIKGGDDLIRLLKKDASGEIDALDVKIFYTQFLHKSYVVAPTVSLTNNIGFDGTGLHCIKTTKFESELYDAKRKLIFEKDISLNQKVIKRLYYFRSSKPFTFKARLIYSIINVLFHFLRRVNIFIKGIYGNREIR